MQKKKNVILLTALLILLIFLMITSRLVAEKNMPISVTIESIENREKILGWRANDTWYFFVPGYANLDKLIFELGTDTQVILNGKVIYSGMSCADFAFDVSYDVEYMVLGTKIKNQIVFMQSGGVATMFLNTQSGTMDYIHARKGNEESGLIRVYSPDGTLDYSGEIKNINGRGNATWEKSEKKAYSINLENETDLLEMGSAEKWILLANAQDPSQIRNKLTADLANMLGLPYTAESEWVDLYLNGCYAGLYLLSERNEVHPQRVNIDEDGFLVSMEKKTRLDKQNYPYVQTERGLAFRLHYPSNVGMNTAAMVEEKLQSLENAILSEEGIDPVTGKSWEMLIDIDSWARVYLLCEIVGNLDSYRASQYFYRDTKDGVIYAGPVWDSDKAMGNDNDCVWSIPNPDVFVVCRYLKDVFVGTRWMRNLLQKDQFYEKVMTLFLDEFYPVIETHLDGLIRSYGETIAAAFELNRVRWQSEVNAGSMQEELAQVSDYVHEHIRFLYSAWVEEVPYCQVSFQNITNDQFRSVVAGQTLEDIPVMGEKEKQMFQGWFREESDEPFDFNSPITEDIALYAKWIDKSKETQIVEKMGNPIKLVPLCVIGAIGFCLLLIDIKRFRKSE